MNSHIEKPIYILPTNIHTTARILRSNKLFSTNFPKSSGELTILNSYFILTLVDLDECELAYLVGISMFLLYPL